MNRSLVTIVVPVYNVEKYLDRCVESIIAQTYQNLEIILVDDCSPDRSPRMCDEWAMKDSRIRVIHKEKNEGLGMARNTGIDNAKGEYLCFLDSDDYIVPDAIEQQAAAITSECSEMVVFGLKCMDAQGNEISEFVPPFGIYTYRNNEVQESFLPDFVASAPNGKSPRLFYMSSCLIMFRTDSVRSANWHFASEREIISEDVYSLLDLMDSIASVTVLPKALYCYCYNGSSLSRKYTPGRYERIKSFYMDTIALCKKKKYSADVLHRVSEPFISFALAALKQEATNTLPVRKRLNNISAILNDELLQQVLYQKRKDYCSLQRKIIFFLMRKKWNLPCLLLFKIKSRNKYSF